MKCFYALFIKGISKIVELELPGKEVQNVPMFVLVPQGQEFALSSPSVDQQASDLQPISDDPNDNTQDVFQDEFGNNFDGSIAEFVILEEELELESAEEAAVAAINQSENAPLTGNDTQDLG